MLMVRVFMVFFTFTIYSYFIILIKRYTAYFDTMMITIVGPKTNRIILLLIIYIHILCLKVLNFAVFNTLFSMPCFVVIATFSIFPIKL